MTTEQPELSAEAEEVAEAPPAAPEPEPEPQVAEMVSESGRTVLTATMLPDGSFQVNGVRDGRQFGRLEQNHEQNLVKD